MLPAQLLNLPSSSSNQHHIDILLHVKSKLVGLCLVGSGNNFRAKCQKKILPNVDNLEIEVCKNSFHRIKID